MKKKFHMMANNKTAILMNPNGNNSSRIYIENVKIDQLDLNLIMVYNGTESKKLFPRPWIKLNNYNKFIVW